MEGQKGPKAAVLSTARISCFSAIFSFLLWLVRRPEAFWLPSFCYYGGLAWLVCLGEF
uniref:Uncharacterized protein n=1 Tax=Rhizophora mucronata TaxID=61149 RepID=A0A2P2QX59_RHIMU